MYTVYPSKVNACVADRNLEPLKSNLSRYVLANIRTLSLSVLAGLAIIYTVYDASGILMPVTISLLLSLLLKEPVRALAKFHLPTPLAAALVIGSIVTLIGFGIYKLSSPASEWINRAPEILEDIEQKIEPYKESLSTLKEVKDKVEEISVTSDESRSDADSGTELVSSSLDLPQTLQTSSTFLMNCVFVTVLVWLILAADGSYLRKFVKIMPSFKDKRRAVELTMAVQACISKYLTTITIINLGVGVVTAVAMWIAGMPNPLLWGALAAVLNFVPYIGPAITWLVILLVSFFSFDTFGQIMTPALIFLFITAIEGQIVSPLSIGRQLKISPVAIFVFLGFMGWLWGVVGMLIAIPLLASFKILCSQIETLNPAAVMLGTD